MARGKSFQEVQRELKHHLCKATVSVKMALDTWMQAVEHLPPHMQNQTTEAATQLVQAALQDAPQIINLSEREQYAWLQKHLPGVSAAMRESVRKQHDACSKRISILRNLPKDELHSVRKTTELNAYVLVEVMIWVFLITLPVAGLLDVLLTVEGHVGYQGMTRQQQLHQSIQLGRTLVEMVGLIFDGICHVSGPMQDQTLQVRAYKPWNSVLGMADAPLTLLDMPCNLSQGIVKASKWLVEFGSWLVPNNASAYVLAHLIRGAIAATNSICSFNAVEQASLLACVRAAVCKLLLHSQLRTKMIEILSREYVVHVLQTIGLTAKHLQDEGMSAAQLQLLLAEFGLTEECLSGRQGVFRETPAADVVPVDGDEGEDMQALVRQMYGSASFK